MVANAERLRMVADVNAASSEHTFNPQTPGVKREPLLRIVMKHITLTYMHEALAQETLPLALLL